MAAFAVTEQDVLHILHLNLGTSATLADFSEVVGKGFSAFTPTRTYRIHVDDGTVFTLKASPPNSPTEANYASNTLSSQHALLELVAANTDIPIPSVRTLDTSLSAVPFPYLLLSHPRGIPLSVAKASGKFTSRQSLLLDLRLGAHLRQLHERIQNDWFGLPSQAADALYSWQEAFTLLLEGILDDAQACGVEIPYADVRRVLSRAIGFYLFDDCEVPSLIMFTGSEDDVLVDFDIDAPPSDGDGEEVPIVGVVALEHALWGDPLLETLFKEPSAALVEGYGGPLIVFARQKTKRLWYTLFLALVIVVQHRRAAGHVGDGERLAWAEKMLGKCVQDLKDAPCY